MRADNSFVLTFAVRISGELRIDTLSACLTALVRRHEALRTRLVLVEGAVHQRVGPAYEFALRLADRVADVRCAVENFFGERLDPETGNVIDARLFKLEHGQHVLAVVMHHLFADLAAGALFFEELWSLYRSRVLARSDALGTDLKQYSDYVAWQRDAFAHRGTKGTLYWQRRLAGAKPVRLSVDSELHARPFSVAELDVSFGNSVSAALVELARRERAPASMALLALYAALLARWSGQLDFVVPFEVSGRDYPAHHKVMGYLAHSLLLRLQLTGEETFADLVRLAAREFITAYSHAGSWNVAAESRELMRGALFQWTPWTPSGGVAADTAAEAVDDLPNLAIETFVTTRLPPEGFQLPFDLELVFWSGADGVRGYGWYRADLFLPATMRRFLSDLRSLADLAVQHPDRPLIPARIR